MVGFESAIDDVVSRLLVNLNLGPNAVTDLGEKLRCFAFDVSAMLSCGQSFGCIENGDSSGLMNAVSTRILIDHLLLLSVRDAYIDTSRIVALSIHSFR